MVMISSLAIEVKDRELAIMLNIDTEFGVVESPINLAVIAGTVKAFASRNADMTDEELATRVSRHLVAEWQRIHDDDGA